MLLQLPDSRQAASEVWGLAQHPCLPALPTFLVSVRSMFTLQLTCAFVDHRQHQRCLVTPHTYGCLLCRLPR